MVICGIYRMYWKQEENLQYIGLSKNLNRRIKQHLDSLNKGTHYNTKLQEVYEKYGPPYSEILEECTEDELNDTEKYYISKYNSYENGLNATLGGEGIHNDSSKKLILHKYTEAQLVEILSLTISKKSLKEIEKITLIPKSTIVDILNKKTHKYLEISYSYMYKRATEIYEKGKIKAIIKNYKNKKFNIINITEFANTHNITYGKLQRAILKKQLINIDGWQLIKVLDRTF